MEEAVHSHPVTGFGRKISLILDTYLSEYVISSNLDIHSCILTTCTCIYILRYLTVKDMHMCTLLLPYFVYRPSSSKTYDICESL